MLFAYEIQIWLEERKLQDIEAWIGLVESASPFGLFLLKLQLPYCFRYTKAEWLSALSFELDETRRHLNCLRRLRIMNRHFFKNLDFRITERRLHERWVDAH